MCEGSLPVTRLSTADADDCWTKRTVSPASMPNLAQLMMALGVLVTVSVLPVVLNVAPPRTTVASPEFAASAELVAKYEITATVSALSLKLSAV